MRKYERITCMSNKFNIYKVKGWEIEYTTADGVVCMLRRRLYNAYEKCVKDINDADGVYFRRKTAGQPFGRELKISRKNDPDMYIDEYGLIFKTYKISIFGSICGMRDCIDIVVSDKEAKKLWKLAWDRSVFNRG